MKEIQIFYFFGASGVLVFFPLVSWSGQELRRRRCVLIVIILFLQNMRVIRAASMRGPVVAARSIASSSRLLGGEAQQRARKERKKKKKKKKKREKDLVSSPVQVMGRRRRTRTVTLTMPTRRLSSRPKTTKRCVRVALFQSKSLMISRRLTRFWPSILQMGS